MPKKIIQYNTGCQRYSPDLHEHRQVQASPQGCHCQGRRLGQHSPADGNGCNYKNDRRNSGGKLRHKFNLIDI